MNNFKLTITPTGHGDHHFNIKQKLLISNKITNNSVCLFGTSQDLLLDMIVPLDC